MIVFSGDLFLGSYKHIIKVDLLNNLSENDTIISNFECVIDKQSFKKRDDKSSILQFSEKTLEEFLSSFPGKKVFSLANNHINDLGEQGLEETIKILKKYGTLCFGAGSIDEVKNPTLITTEKKKISLIALSSDDPSVMAIKATKEQKGVLDMNSCDIINMIEKSKSLSDYTVLLPHWGREYIDYPLYALRKLAYKWIDVGADLIIGNHPHVIQGKEIYKGKQIYYSLGNFIFPDFITKHGKKHKWKKNNNRSILVFWDIDNTERCFDLGLYYNTKKYSLTIDDNTIVHFKYKSIPLDINEFSIKKYQNLWEENYLNILLSERRNNRSIINKIYRMVKKRYYFFNKRNALF